MSSDIKKAISSSDYQKIWESVAKGNRALMRGDFANAELLAIKAWNLLKDGRRKSIQETILLGVVALLLSAVMDDTEEAKKENYTLACQQIGLLKFDIAVNDSVGHVFDETPVSYATDLFKGLLFCLQIYSLQPLKNDVELVKEACELIRAFFSRHPHLVREICLSNPHPEIIETILQIAVILDELIHETTINEYYYKRLFSDTIKYCINSIKDARTSIDSYIQAALFYTLMIYTLDPQSNSYARDAKYYANKALEIYQHLSKLNKYTDSQRSHNERFAARCFYLAQRFDLETAIIFIKYSISFLQGYEHAAPLSSKVLQKIAEWLNKQSRAADSKTPTKIIETFRDMLLQIEKLQAKWKEYETKKKLEAEKELQEKRKQQSETLSGLQFESLQSPLPKEVNAIEMGSLFPNPSPIEPVKEKKQLEETKVPQTQSPHPKKEKAEESNSQPAPSVPDVELATTRRKQTRN